MRSDLFSIGSIVGFQRARAVLRFAYRRYSTRKGAAAFILAWHSVTLPDTVRRLPELKNGAWGEAIDYGGSGGSTGTPTEFGLLADARAAFDFVHAAAPASRIAVFGESLGTGIGRPRS